MCNFTVMAMIVDNNIGHRTQAVNRLMNLFIIVRSKQILRQKYTLGIRIQIVRVAGEHADHSTNVYFG